MPRLPHPDILWIQIITASETYYISVVYSRPNDFSNHILILSTLESNFEEFKRVGTVITMGDFNSGRLDQTNTYKKKLLSFLAHQRLTSVTQPSLTDSSATHIEPPSFLSQQGASHPDHIIIPQSHSHLIQAIKTHTGIMIGSDHCLLSISLATPEIRTDSMWGPPIPRSRIDWTDKNKAIYSAEITRLLSASSHQPTNPSHLAKHILNTLYKARRLVLSPPPTTTRLQNNIN
jgi:hypothetical protein